jgi:ribose/xylose/arabinose/galactoside ABC-type transport system permease subunit
VETGPTASAGIVIILLVAVVGIINPKFITLNNVIAIFQQIAVLGVLTMACPCCSSAAALTCPSAA